MKAIRSNTSKTTIVVRWDGATERERGAQRIKEYLVRYEAPGGSVKEKRVLATDSTIHLSGLRLYTRYTIQIAAVTHSNTPGNFSKVFHITTPEGGRSGTVLLDTVEICFSAVRSPRFSDPFTHAVFHAISMRCCVQNLPQPTSYRFLVA